MPKTAEWLDANGEVLDLLGEAVRKPLFTIPCLRRTTYEMGSPESVAAFQFESKRDRFPDASWSFYHERLAVQRLHEIVRGELQVRILLRIGERQDDAALFDLETMMRLAKHLQRSPDLYTALLGISTGAMASGIVSQWLEQPDLTDETLAKIQNMFASLPPLPQSELSRQVHWYYRYSFLLRWPSIQNRRHAMVERKFLEECPSLPIQTGNATPPIEDRVNRRLLQNLPMDRNIAGCEMTRLRAINGAMCDETDPVRYRALDEQWHLETDSAFCDFSHFYFRPISFDT
ncbi:MAG: hypothetical protein PHE53_03650 [Thermoguttaceae bacterium]|nr:hypothetical protein [Thermoguttaceae bacterium]